MTAKWKEVHSVSQFLFLCFQSRSRVNVEVDCIKSKNAVSHRDSLDHTVEVEPQSMAVS